ncbi:acyl-CoA thioesterase [Litchfieldia salsa]|uniref:Acyl-CoA thioester hydrolase n=1 Tax=Litchfieldia salsa TaxID=930152 RepID=A0A1H0RMG3_9BACI|nr:thioesterase family protein [Litchfieldia salsa]SDP30693.1 acyl-CoA thioester hydrolase [Litchfieldia salsa]
MKHELDISVRFCETDALGHVNNVSYFIYLEDARVKFFEMLGTSSDLSDWKFIVASIKCDFVGQGYFNRNLTVTTRVSKVGNKSFELEHNIFEKSTNRLIATGSVVMVYFNFDMQRSEPIPEVLRGQLNQFLTK